jgi:hypothetical protein
MESIDFKIKQDRQTDTQMEKLTGLSFMSNIVPYYGRFGERLLIVSLLNKRLLQFPQILGGIISDPKLNL